MLLRVLVFVVSGLFSSLSNAGEKTGGKIYTLYRDISADQSRMAHEILNRVYSSNLAGADRLLPYMHALEEEKSLPPLSSLLEVAYTVMAIQNGDYESPQVRDSLVGRVEAAFQKAKTICERRLKKEPNHPTYMLIRGGVAGFMATLKIHSDPSRALTEGFQALKLLERAMDLDGRIKDCHMGTGIFHCTTANASLIVRATLKVFGRSVNMRAGLEALRISAYSGQYTSVQSQLFLIQFLTPYDDELRREKREIFASLESVFPSNPYYTFLKNDEALCFYPDSFMNKEAAHNLRAKLPRFSQYNFASRRFLNLVKYQYALLDENPKESHRPDSGFVFPEYAYYPVFLDGLRTKWELEKQLDQSLDGLGDTEKEKVLQERVRSLRDSSIHLVENSTMNTPRKKHYLWHVKDAFRMRKAAAPTVKLEQDTVTGR